ncbi:hypothetical protein Zmor_002230 [Zophobas morio]|uniref:Uncharacterized protein n=1 Tax=Zophobas morio TaxID=2755281 RepID=A0AA38J604_9CUCU|nr:hypothetical protein Zmor_002230 [Zophobas morio]
MYQLVTVVYSVNVNMIKLYGVADGNSVERVPNSAIPCTRTFTSVVQHLRDHGTFKPQTQDLSRGRTERILQAEEQILERDEQDPDISTRINIYFKQ